MKKKNFFAPVTDSTQLLFPNVNEVIIMHKQYSLRDSYSVTLSCSLANVGRKDTYSLLWSRQFSSTKEHQVKYSTEPHDTRTLSNLSCTESKDETNMAPSFISFCFTVNSCFWLTGKQLKSLSLFSRASPGCVSVYSGLWLISSTYQIGRYFL